MALEDATVSGVDVSVSSTKRDGINIKVYVPKSSSEPIGTVIFSHGYTEHLGRYEGLAKAICDCNWACILYDVRGHGDSEGLRGHIGTYKQYMKDLENVQQVAEDVKTQTGNLFFVGHSNGGLITLLYLETTKASKCAKIKGCMLSAPFISSATKLSLTAKMLLSFISVVKPTMQSPFEPGFETHLTHDVAMHVIRRNDTKCFNHSTLGWFNQARRAQKKLWNNLDKIQVPVCFLVAGQDRVCDSEAMRKFAQRLQTLGKQSRVIEYPDFYHEVFLELEKDKPTKELQTTLSRL